VINYKLKEDYHVKLNIYNLLGQKVRILENRVRSKGLHSVIWDGKNNQGKEVASGIYFYQLATDNYKETKKLVLIK
jgi:flagellar hook assembly protein FlgD